VQREAEFRLRRWSPSGAATAACELAVRSRAKRKRPRRDASAFSCRETTSISPPASVGTYAWMADLDGTDFTSADRVVLPDLHGMRILKEVSNELQEVD